MKAKNVQLMAARAKDLADLDMPHLRYQAEVYRYTPGHREVLKHSRGELIARVLLKEFG